jgi:exopolysaccharide biosynthesis polyprenyl glycosylphosphotransferase
MSEAHIYRQKLALLVADILAFLTAFGIAMQLRFSAALGIFEPSTPPWGEMLQSLPVMLSVWLFTLKVSGAYAIERRRLVYEVARVVNALFVMAAILLSITFFYRGFSYSRGFTVLFLPAILVLTTIGRIAARVLKRHIEGLDERARVILIGSSVVAKHFIEKSADPESRLTIVGVLDDEAEIGSVVHGEVRVGGRTADLHERAKSLGATGIIITSSRIDHEKVLELLDVCLAANLEWQLVPSAYELMLDRVTMDVIHGVPLLGMRRSNIRGTNRLIKRIVDVIVASLMLIILSPLMIAVAILIRLSSKGPVFFEQDRVGENGEVFRFLKFRTMYVNNDPTIHKEYAQKWITQNQAHTVDGQGALYKIRKDPRIIPTGGFLRKYSVDELPQLFNVLKGDMSLIGPRPPIPYEVEVYRNWHRRRFEGPPGITGLWQVSGRNRLSFDEMVKLDIEYLENWSFSRDLKILWRTMGVVLFDRAY